MKDYPANVLDFKTFLHNFVTFHKFFEHFLKILRNKGKDILPMKHIMTSQMISAKLSFSHQDVLNSNE